MKKRYYILIILAIIICSINSFGQENSSKSLLVLTGNWKVENYAKQADSYKHLGTTSSKIVQEHEGKFISERSKFLTAFGEINMITFIGFDTKVNKFKLTAMDKEYGLMDIYLGKWKNSQLIFDNLKSDLPVKMQDGKELSFRLTYKEITEKSFTHLVEGTTDKGKTWFVFSKAVFNRLKS